jgi:alkyl sulfatase BDS1-like metallo-beta-lactamase superfamily hydrolase
MDAPKKRRLRVAALLAGAVVLVALALTVGPFVIMAAEGSGMDPRIPSALHVAPSIDPELREHTRIFDKKIHKVGGNVYSAVGWGLANIVFIEGTDGVVVVDTGESIDQARDVLAELRKITPKPVAAVVLTHHHADHVLGTSVFVSAADAAQGKVPIFAHESLVRRYVDENGAIAELQTVRSTHMYGAALLPADREGGNDGIGPYLGRGEGSFVAPNRTFSDKLDATVAGVRMQMLYVPSEAESEIAVYLPDEKILLSAEVIQDHTFPNMYTIRGARYRDPVQWVRSIDALRDWDADAMVLQHGPPVLGHDEVARVLTLYRDEIQFVHDQTVRYMNQGMTAVEIAETVKLPPHLAGAKPWGEQFYGSVEASVRNVYGGYVGWFQGDPVDLSPTPPVEYARRTVAMMGGRDAVLAAARTAYEKGDCQFAAELTTPLVRIDKGDMDARHLKAAAFRKMGYASGNANYRNYYLVSAMELDDQIPAALYLHEAGKKLSSGFKGLPPASQVESLPPRLKAEETLDEDVAFVVRYGAEGEAFSLHLRRGVLEVAHGARPAPAFTLDVTADSMGSLLAGESLDDVVASGGVTVTGDTALAKRVFGSFERPFTRKPEVVVR